MGAAEAGVLEELVELTVLRCVKDLLEGNDIRVDSAQLTVDESETARITIVVLHVDREDS
jgi:hypothetical protein